MRGASFNANHGTIFAKSNFSIESIFQNNSKNILQKNDKEKFLTNNETNFSMKAYSALKKSKNLYYLLKLIRIKFITLSLKIDLIIWKNLTF